MHGDVDARAPSPVVGPPFAPVQRHDVEWVNTVTPEQLLDLVASRSYVLTAAPQARAAILDAVRRLIDTHPALAGRAQIGVPYITECYRTELLADR